MRTSPASGPAGTWTGPPPPARACAAATAVAAARSAAAAAAAASAFARASAAARAQPGGSSAVRHSPPGASHPESMCASHSGASSCAARPPSSRLADARGGLESCKAGQGGVRRGRNKAGATCGAQNAEAWSPAKQGKCG
eukprot:356824-Chlamydomonas_euryale.AAC.1